jgi:hypothetical protein
MFSPYFVRDAKTRPVLVIDLKFSIYIVPVYLHSQLFQMRRNDIDRPSVAAVWAELVRVENSLHTGTVSSHRCDSQVVTF